MKTTHSENKPMTRWSKAGAPKGRHVNRRFPPSGELEALVGLFNRKVAANEPPTVAEVSLLYRMIEGYKGEKKVVRRLRKLIKLPAGVVWKIADHKNMTDTQHIAGVKFDSEKQMDGFFQHLAGQAEPKCFDTFLEYVETYKASTAEDSDAEMEAEGSEDSEPEDAKKTGATKTDKTEFTTPAKKKTMAEEVTPTTGTGTASMPLALDDSESDEEYIKFMNTAWKERKARKDRKRKFFKTDKSEPEKEE